MKAFYQSIIASGNFFQHFFLLAVRLYWGYAFFQAGYAKFLNPEQIAEYFSSLSIPLPLISVYLASAVELVCGVLLFIGFGARLAALPLIFVMITALLTAHYSAVIHIMEDPAIFIAQTPFNYLMAALMVFSFGPGWLSLDGMLKKAWTSN
jgi:putative oxidoreductase